MKTIFTLFISLLIFTNILFSQKLKTEYLNVEYTGLPARPLNPEFKAYSISITDPFASFNFAGINAESTVKKHLTLDGFKALPIGGDFHININIGQYVLIGHETKEKSEKKTRKVTPKDETTTSDSSNSTSKSSDGKARVSENSEVKKTEATPEKSNSSTKEQTNETYYVTTYYKSITYTLPIAYTIIDYQGKKIKEGTLVAANKKLNHTSVSYTHLTLPTICSV